jgi:hypothetical protein
LNSVLKNKYSNRLGIKKNFRGRMGAWGLGVVGFSGLDLDVRQSASGRDIALAIVAWRR